MINKNSILITSLGRTGTEFFAKFFQDILPDCVSLHEPDIFELQSLKIPNYRDRLINAGIWRLVVLKLLGKWSLVKISDERFFGRIDGEKAAQFLVKQRESFISERPGSIYVESNIGYYGLLDVTPLAFKNHKAVLIVRDGRDWVRSAINWGEIYGKKGIRKYFSHTWPSAEKVPGDALASSWNQASEFQKACWAWANLNAYAIKTMQQNPAARMYKFEDIFKGPDRYDYLNDLVRFTTALPGIDPASLKKTDGWLDQKIHPSSNQFPAWQEWTAQQKNQFDEICGPLMSRLNYHY